MTIKRVLLFGLLALLVITLVVFYIIDNGRNAEWTTYLLTDDDSACGTDLHSLAIRNDLMWIEKGNCSTHESDIFAFDGKSWHNTNMHFSLESVKVTSSGQVWMVEAHKREGSTISVEVKKYIDGDWSTVVFTDMETIQKGDLILDVWKIDKQGRVWIGFHDQTRYEPGISMFDGQKWTTYKRTGAKIIPEEYEKIVEMAFDSQGKAWIVTDRGNVSIFDGQKWIHNDTNPMVYFPRAVAFDDQDRVWFAPQEGGVYIFDGEKWIYISPTDFGLYEPNPNIVNLIHTIVFDTNGNAWLRTGSGDLIWKSNNEWEVKADVGSGAYGDYDRFPIVFDNKGRMWTLDYYYLIVFNGNTWKRFTHENSGLVEFKELTFGGLDIDQNGFLQITSHNESGISVVTISPDDIADTSTRLLDLRQFITRIGYPLFPFILDSLWLGIFLDFHKNSRLVFLLLFLGSIFLIASQRLYTYPDGVFDGLWRDITRRIVYYVGFAGIAGEFLGAIIDKARRKGNLSITFAIRGAIIGFVLALIASFR